MTADHQIIEAAGREIRLSNPNKVMFAERGETKLDLARFYLGVAEPLMAALGDRPTLMERHPDGASGKSFFQKRVPAGAPDWLETTVMSTPNGTISRALVLADMAHVLWALNLGCLGFHPWPVRASYPATTDEMRIDLDPAGGVGFDEVRVAAHETRRVLAEMGIDSFAKTSGSRGIHLHVGLLPRWDSYDVRRAAVALARELEARHPSLITAAWWKEERGERVFVDYNQNAPHKTVFGAWSVRARAAAQVSTPLRWDDLPGVDPDGLTMPVVLERVNEHGDPWDEMRSNPQDLTPLLDLADAATRRGLPDAPWPPQYPKMPHEPPRVSPSRRARQS